MFWQVLLGVWMTLVIAGAFLYAPPAEGLGELSRIAFFHIPVAWVAVLAFLVAMINSVQYLRRRDLENDLKAAVSSELGLAFSILATITGSIFAKSTWGSYWNWDPRETSIFVLLLIYGAYFALRSAVEGEERRASLSAVYSIVAFVTVPFLVFVVPRVYYSLHPDPLVNTRGSLDMEARMLQVFFASLIAFTGLYVWIYRLQLAIARLGLKMEAPGEAVAGSHSGTHTKKG